MPFAYDSRETSPDGTPASAIGTYDPMPDGWYLAEITSADEKATKAGGSQLVLKWLIRGPSHVGRA